MKNQSYINEYHDGISTEEFQKLLSDISNNVFTSSTLRIGLLHEDSYGPALTDRHIIQLVEAITQSPYITNLDLSYNMIGDEGALALSTLDTIKEINLHYNKITAVGASTLGKSKLVRLSLASNPIGHNSECSSDLEKLVDNLCHNDTIKYLDISFCDIPSTSIAQLIRKNLIIEELQLGGYIKDSALKYISDNTNLKKLYIQRSHITELGAYYLSKNISLEVIHIRESSIDDMSVKGLTIHPSLRELKLVDSNITLKGAKQFYDSNIEDVVLFNAGKHRFMPPRDIKEFQNNFKQHQKHIKLKKQQDYYYKLTENISYAEINPDMNNFHSIQQAIDTLQQRWANENKISSNLLGKSKRIATEVGVTDRIESDNLLLAQREIFGELQKKYGKQKSKQLLKLINELHNQSFKYDLEEVLASVDPLKGLEELMGLNPEVKESDR